MAYGKRTASKKMSLGTVPGVNIQKSRFNLSEGHKTVFNADTLVPIHVEEIYPGDTFNTSIDGIIRTNPMVVPIMHDIDVTTFSFFVPNRILWDNWKKFMGEKVKRSDHNDYIIPQVSFVDGAKPRSFWDYIGIPTGVTTTVSKVPISALFYRAYLQIYNDWFRSQMFEDEIEFDRGDTTLQVVDTKVSGKESSDFLLKVNKKPDYFTTCLPSPQLGEPVTLPLGAKAEVMAVHNLATELNTFGTFGSGDFRETNFKRGLASEPVTGHGMDVVVPHLTGSSAPSSDFKTHLYADLSQATASTVNALREAFQVQRILEKEARSGTRYVEIIKAHYGVTVPDSRLQRAEFLGSQNLKMDITPVAQTSETTASSAQGGLAGVAHRGFSERAYRYTAQEHGILMTVMVARSSNLYQQGLHRRFNKQKKLDYMLPSLWHLGEQDVKNSEIFLEDQLATNDVFGYQERYRELREGVDRVSGELRSQVHLTLDVWHLGVKFKARPSLNIDFMKQYSPIERCLAITSQPQFFADLAINIDAYRPLPTTVIPGMIDHF